jgi:hypothetical protein
MARAKRPKLERDVFINCPFDGQYAPLFHALVFTVAACGYRPRCTLEENDSGAIRYSKLTSLILSCRFGIHDLSRVELDEATGLPRFNMPIELGLYLGAASFGGKAQRRKRTLILARSRKEWSPSISDLAGMDPQFHADKPERLVKCVRDFLHTTPAGALLPGETALLRAYERFRSDLPAAAKEASQTAEEALRYRNYAYFVHEFLNLQEDA